jgi:hypothetical protein
MISKPILTLKLVYSESEFTFCPSLDFQRNALITNNQPILDFMSDLTPDLQPKFGCL